MTTASLMEHLSIIKDFRQDWKVEHKLSDILLLTICGVICEAWLQKTWRESGTLP